MSLIYAWKNTRDKQTGKVTREEHMGMGMHGGGRHRVNGRKTYRISRQ